MGDVVVGTCSWTDRTMIERWYPRGVASAEARLRYYAARFDTVEVDSTFYGLPRREVAEAWVRRTPDDFTFHVKAYGLMTGHEVDERALHPDLRDFPYEVTTRGRVRNPPREMIERSFEIFLQELEPLHAAGRMGGVLMQYPPYVTATHREHMHHNLEMIELGAELLRPHPVFVEFRHASWVSEANLPKTLRFLSERGLTYVCVDAPQVAGRTAMPPVSAVSSPLGYVRFHGRNVGTWHARTGRAADRFDYLYTPQELEEWTEPIHRLAERTERTWVMFNNCKYDYAPRNAKEMAEILGDVVAPRRGGKAAGEPADEDSPVGPRDEAGEQLGLGM